MAKGRWMTWTLVAALLLTAGVGTGVQAVAAQQLGIGYVVNAPSLSMGGSAYGVLPIAGGLGVYVDVKFQPESVESEEGFEPSLTVEDAIDGRDVFRRDEDNWRSFNIALVRPMTRSLAVYAGAGWSERARYAQYEDLERERGRLGYYWVEDEDGSGSTVNVLGGVLMSLTSRLNAQFGVESAPGGFTVGFSYLLIGGR